MLGLRTYLSASQSQVRKQANYHQSNRHVPAFILQVPDVPYTLTGKKVEVAVKRIISGEQPKVARETLANPDALAHYYDIPELK